MLHGGEGDGLRHGGRRSACEHAALCITRTKRAESLLKCKGVTYAQLVGKLAAIGIDEKEANVRKKLSEGKLSEAFLLQCLMAIGTELLRSD